VSGQSFKVFVNQYSGVILRSKPKEHKNYMVNDMLIVTLSPMPLFTPSQNSMDISSIWSIDPVNAIVVLLSSIVAVIALFFAVKANKKANEIANKQRIDSLIPDVLIACIKARITLVTSKFEFIRINTIALYNHDPSLFLLNGKSEIRQDELFQKARVEMEIKNSSSKSARVIISVTGIDEKEIDLCGLGCENVILENESTVSSLLYAQSIIHGQQNYSFQIQYYGLGTDSYDRITGDFSIPYQENRASESCIKISDYNHHKERIYNV
jgi:hypothetical protein